MIWKNFTSKATGWLWGTPGAYILLYIIGKYALSLSLLSPLFKHSMEMPLPTVLLS